jgi:hypothetical protein
VIDVLIVSLGSTSGLRAADEELRGSLQRAGASVELVRAAPPGEARTLMLTDLGWARAARAAAVAGLRQSEARSVIYSSTTAALLWPRPGVVRFDAPAAGNRPGRHGLWQRPLERRRFAQSSLLLPWSEGGLDELPGLTGRATRADRVPVPPVPVPPVLMPPALVLPVPIEPSGPPASERDIAALTYAANPMKKGLDRVLEAWLRVRRPDEELVVAGVDRRDLAKAGLVLPAEGVRVTGLLAPADYRSLLRRTRVFVCAPRREDYGVAQLEALADGCLLVTTSAPGPYAALPIARALDPRLVSDDPGSGRRVDLGIALRVALDEPVADYAVQALRALEPFRREAIDRAVAEQLLPRLLAGRPR